MYSVSINNTWNNDEKATKEFFELKGCTVNQSRSIGDYDAFFEGKLIAHIFNSQNDQIAYLRLKGLI